MEYLGFVLFIVTIVIVLSIAIKVIDKQNNNLK